MAGWERTMARLAITRGPQVVTIVHQLAVVHAQAPTSYSTGTFELGNHCQQGRGKVPIDAVHRPYLSQASSLQLTLVTRPPSELLGFETTCPPSDTTHHTGRHWHRGTKSLGAKFALQTHPQGAARSLEGPRPAVESPT